MRFSFAALAGLAAISSNFGVEARAVSNALVQRAPPVVPRPEPVAPKPVAPKPVTPEPSTPEPVTPGEPVAPEPVVPKPVKPEEAAPAGREDVELMSDSDSEYYDSTPPNSPIRETPFNFKTTTVKIDSATGTDDNPCGVSIGGLKKRAGEDSSTPADAPTGWAKLYHYLKHFSDVDPTKLVFYSGDAGEAMARAFVAANPEYRFFFNIFEGPKALTFGQNLKASGLEPTVPQDEASKALATLAIKPLVFNYNGAKDTSWLKSLEIPRMFAAGEIIQMKDNALSPTDTAGSIELPKWPKDGNAAGC